LFVTLRINDIQHYNVQHGLIYDTQHK